MLLSLILKSWLQASWNMGLLVPLKSQPLPPWDPLEASELNVIAADPSKPLGLLSRRVIMKRKCQGRIRNSYFPCKSPRASLFFLSFFFSFGTHTPHLSKHLCLHNSKIFSNSFWPISLSSSDTIVPRKLLGKDI